MNKLQSILTGRSQKRKEISNLNFSILIIVIEWLICYYLFIEISEFQKLLINLEKSIVLIGWIGYNSN